MMRRFVIEHPTLTFILAFVFLVVFPIAIYKTIKSAGAQELRAERGAICVEKNVPAYEVYYYGDDYAHTTYYKEYSREPRYRDYDRRYRGDTARPHGPPAWGDPGPAWGYSDDYEEDDGYVRKSYDGYARPHGPPAW